MATATLPVAALNAAFEPGTCRFCGCTDERACPGGCWWIDEEETVCSAKPCVDRYFAEQRVRVDEMFEAVFGRRG